MQAAAPGSQINQKMAIVMAGITKVFAGEIIEEGKEHNSQKFGKADMTC